MGGSRTWEAGVKDVTSLEDGSPQEAIVIGDDTGPMNFITQAHTLHLLLYITKQQKVSKHIS